MSFSISNTTCLFITLESVIASVTLLSWRLVDLVATFQAILGCEICLYLDISDSHSTVIIQCVSEVKMRCLPPPPPPHAFLLSLSQVEGDGNEEVLSCVGGRSFRSVRERWWYIALSKCGVSTDLWRPADTPGSSSLQGQVYYQTAAMATHRRYHTNRLGGLTRKHTRVVTLFIWRAAENKQSIH